MKQEDKSCIMGGGKDQPWAQEGRRARQDEETDQSFFPINCFETFPRATLFSNPFSFWVERNQAGKVV